MKIPHSVRSLYADQLPLNERLKDKVDELLRTLAARGRWHYESRIKSETSFALKLESGRIRDPRATEDFFACTLVVQNLSVIEEVEQKIRELFRSTPISFGPEWLTVRPVVRINRNSRKLARQDCAVTFRRVADRARFSEADQRMEGFGIVTTALPKEWSDAVYL